MSKNKKKQFLTGSSCLRTIVSNLKRLTTELEISVWDLYSSPLINVDHAGAPYHCRLLQGAPDPRLRQFQGKCYKLLAYKWQHVGALNHCRYLLKFKESSKICNRSAYFLRVNEEKGCPISHVLSSKEGANMLHSANLKRESYSST